MEDLIFRADGGPELFEGEAVGRGFSVEDGFVEEGACVGKTALPEVVGSVVAGVVVGKVDAELGEDALLLALVPAVGEQDSAYVPEDGLNGRGSHWPSGKSEPRVVCSHAAIS